LVVDNPHPATDHVRQEGPKRALPTGPWAGPQASRQVHKEVHHEYPWSWRVWRLGRLPWLRPRWPIRTGPTRWWSGATKPRRPLVD